MRKTTPLPLAALAALLVLAALLPAAAGAPGGVYLAAGEATGDTGDSGGDDAVDGMETLPERTSDRADDDTGDLTAGGYSVWLLLAVMMVTAFLGLMIVSVLRRRYGVKLDLAALLGRDAPKEDEESREELPAASGGATVTYGGMDREDDLEVF